MEASRTCQLSKISNGKVKNRPLILIWSEDFNSVLTWQRKYWSPVYALWKEPSRIISSLPINPFISMFWLNCRLAVTCIFIAHKFYSDFHYDIEDFSISSGITIREINKLESLALDLLDYNLILSERDYYGVLLFGKMCRHDWYRNNQLYRGSKSL